MNEDYSYIQTYELFSVINLKYKRKQKTLG